MLGDGLVTYRYDSEGRLESASTGQGEDAPTTKYAHNALGQRVFKTEPLYSSSTQSSTSNKTGKNLNNLLADDDEPQEPQPGLIQQILSFVSKLWSPSTSDAEKLGFSYTYAEDGSLLGEYGSGGSHSSGTAQYIYLPTASGPMPIAAVIKGQTYAVHSDHLNTPRKLTQADGQTAWQWAYSAFGDEQPTTGAKRFTNETTNPTTGATSIPEVTFNLRYPGQYFDKETKLHYNYFRSYRPADGAYTQGDPIGLAGGWNRFGYVGGNPLNAIDPLGLYGSSPWLRTLVPGQVSFDRGMTALENGNYGAATISFGTMLGEQVLTASSFGLNRVAAPAAELCDTAAVNTAELNFGRKLDFLLNRRIDQSNAYNAARAAGNAERIGIADTAANRSEIARLFNQAYRDSSSILGPGSVPGSNLREFFLPGVTSTGSKIQFVKKGGQIITIIAK